MKTTRCCSVPCDTHFVHTNTLKPTARLEPGTRLLLDTGKEVLINSDQGYFYIVYEEAAPDVKFAISNLNIKEVLK